MIVVTAASGALGRLVVEQLLTRFPDRPVVAAVRDPGRCADLTARGVDVRHGDYDDPATLRSAFRGADRLLLISSPVMDPDHRTRQHLAAVAAAVDSGVRAVAYTSFLGADRGGDGPNAAHHATERAIIDSGLGYTLLRHPFYTDAFVDAGLRDAVTSGKLVSGTGGRGLNTALRSDLAAAAATVLTDDAHLGHGYDLTGALWTYPQLAATLTEVTGRPVEHVDGTVETPIGFLMNLAKAGLLERQTTDLERLLGRPPTSLRQTVTEALRDA
ncbi:NAD(P)H-binding protein [Dactylosporangium sp. NPDC049525]|uniref:NAD(P)H-binding protein n=1 Tax=Dactylosporangium sp. NPDC049525 TaxID=3154730 RepID=UPI003427466D